MDVYILHPTSSPVPKDRLSQRQFLGMQLGDGKAQARPNSCVVLSSQSLCLPTLKSNVGAQFSELSEVKAGLTPMWVICPR